MRFRIIHGILVLLLITGLAACAGSYKDGSGGTHPWSVGDSHSLLWEGKAYIPFGVIFQPKSFIEQTDANSKADQNDLEAFKVAGITDVMLKPGRPITTIPAEIFQKMIDQMEQNGLHYGIDLYNPPYGPISGYSIQPTVNRTEISASSTITRDFPNAETVVTVVCDARTGEIKSYATSVPTNGQIKVPIVLQANGSHIVLFYPENSIDESSPSYSMPDLWTGYDSQRDRLLIYLKKIKFGPGLRFFIDPFSEKFGINNEMKTFVPISRDYRMQFSAWLSRKYGNPRDISNAWGILRHDVTSYDEATRYIPLWTAGRGAASVFDDGTGKTYGVDVTSSIIWSDIEAFRNQTLSEYMDSMADVLKRMIADVPVVFTATGLQPIFQPKNDYGFNGLATPASPNESIIPDVGKVLSLAESSQKPPWMIAKLGPAGIIYQQKDQLFAAINSLHDLGSKGFFISLEGKTVSSADLMVWLAEYASISAKDARFASLTPRVLYYPDVVPGLRAKRLKSGVWWIPSLNKGGQMALGSLFAGYVMFDQKTGTPDLYVWSPSGNQNMTLVTDSPILMINDVGEATEYKGKKGRVQLVITPDPQKLKGISPERFLPVETVLDAVNEFEKLITRADKSLLDTTVYKKNLKAAKDMVAKNQLGIALDLARTNTLDLSQHLRGVEAENSMIHAPVKSPFNK